MAEQRDDGPRYEKLHLRALKIVQLATGLDKESAEKLLRICDNETKTAILVGRTHMTPREARKQLAAHNGVLHIALEAI